MEKIKINNIYRINSIVSHGSMFLVRSKMKNNNNKINNIKLM